MFGIHEAIEGVSMKGPIKIEKSSSLISIKINSKQLNN
jgi:hypothetical protein